MSLKKRGEKETQQVTFSTSSQILVFEDSSRGRSKIKNPSGRDKSRGRSKSINKTFKCFYSDKIVHKKKNCFKYKNDVRDGKDVDNKGQCDKAVYVVAEDVLIMLDGGDVCLTTSDDISWGINSCASFYATSCRDFFNTCVIVDLRVVKIGNNETSKSFSNGNVYIVTDYGCKLVLRNVRHISDLKMNLISTGMLDDEGYVSQFLCSL